VREIYRLNGRNPKHSNGSGYITRSGHTMVNEDIISDLERKVFLENENEKLKKEKADLIEWLKIQFNERESSKYMDEQDKAYVYDAVLDQIEELNQGK